MSAPKILSVDDSRMIHTLINKGFAPYDVQMVFASNGAEGLEAAARERPDVILLDVTMPVMDGVECLSKLKADPALKDIPVIMLTAEAGKENVLKIAKMGVRDYIVKPFTEAAVIDRVSRIVDLKPKGAAPAAAPAPAAAAPSPAASTAKKKRTVLDAIKILVVDDSRIVRRLVGAAAAVIGADCSEAEEGGAALRLLESDPAGFSLVCLDWTMPGMDGISFLRALRADLRWKTLPVLMLTAVADRESILAAIRAGATAYMTKPFNETDLQAKMLDCLGMGFD